MSEKKPHDDGEGVEAEEFLRALLAIKPKDAAEVREAADTKADEDD